MWQTESRQAAWLHSVVSNTTVRGTTQYYVMAEASSHSYLTVFPYSFWLANES
jgi:hypothetical protein